MSYLFCFLRHFVHFTFLLENELKDKDPDSLGRIRIWIRQLLTGCATLISWRHRSCWREEWPNSYLKISLRIALAAHVPVYPTQYGYCCTCVLCVYPTHTTDTDAPVYCVSYVQYGYCCTCLLCVSFSQYGYWCTRVLCVSYSRYRYCCTCVLCNVYPMYGTDTAAPVYCVSYVHCTVQILLHLCIVCILLTVLILLHLCIVYPMYGTDTAALVYCVYPTHSTDTAAPVYCISFAQYGYCCTCVLCVCVYYVQNTVST